MSLRQIFLEDIPLLDVRAPAEFARGAFPSATNLPVLNDIEREQVGTCFKDKGADAATALGHELVKGDKRQERIEQWRTFINHNPTAQIYCFRGGQRSHISQQWLRETGIRIQLISGGYKVMRRYLLDVFERLPTITVISGRTGVGKTVLLERIVNSIDLECLANHRGSAFGARLAPQPTQIDFENALAIKVLKLDKSIVVEDEGRMIGRLTLPPQLQEKMKKASLVLLEDSLSNRVCRIHQEYVVMQFAEMAEEGVESPTPRLEEKFTTALAAIKKRLGGAGYDRIKKEMNEAFTSHKKGDVSQHKVWIESLLRDYYDPMYDYQLGQKKGRILRTGNQDELTGYLGTRFKNHQ